MANSWKFYKETVTNRPVFEMQDGTKYYPVTPSEFATLVQLNDHINDTTDAHDASAISIADAGGYFTGTEVETALQELGAGGGGGAPTTADYLVGTADAGLSNEIAVGTTPGGELGGTWASPTVDPTHSGSSHAGVISTHEGAADPHTGYQLESEKGAANGYLGIGASIIQAPFKFYPVEDDGVAQTAAGFYAGTGVPNNANGSNGDFYFRSDGGALTTIYQRRVGIWVGLV